ncbi:MAG TPA: site-specific integrase [Phycisphaerae bacterium]|nr:site-specific integrase [Phycisphaerae bacterium]
MLELLDRFLEYASKYYRSPDGSPTSELACFKSIIAILADLYGETVAEAFGPRELKVARDAMIAKGWTRGTVNKGCSRARSIFRWAAEETLLSPAVYQGLTVVSGLRRGRCDAPEGRKVKPVRAEHIRAIKPYVPEQIWALIELQQLTGARPGELVGLRPADIDMSGKVWIATPNQHKTAHHGHDRTIYFGPRAKQIIQPFRSGRAVDKPLFSPIEAEQERLRKRRAARVTPTNQGNNPGSNRARVRRRSPRDQYDVASYRRSIQRACDKAGIPRWHPHQLRHNAAFDLRRRFDIEVARVILGHSSPSMTDLYGEFDRRKAVAVMEKVG